MNAVTKTHFGHWSDSARDLMDGNPRVSLAEQQDYMPDRPRFRFVDSVWFVVLLCLSPIFVIGGVSLVASLIRT